MHVVHVYKDYAPVVGGIENHLKLLAEGQARRGHRVQVLVTSRDRRTTVRLETGVEVIRAGRLAHVASTPLSLDLVRRLRRLEPDVCHLHFPYPPGEVAQLLVGRSRALVVAYHCDIVRQRWLGRLYRPILRRVLRRADRILPATPANLRGAPVLRPFADRCTLVPLGIDVERFARAAPERVAAIEGEYRGPRVLFVGRLRHYKGVDVLIRAMETVEATLLVAGTGPLSGAWHRLAEASPAAPRIHFLGDVPDSELPALLTVADVFVLPASSRAEAFGLAQVEAMAAGTPVVSTEVGTATSVVNRDGETGLVVPPNDPAALAAALRRLLGDGELRARMGRAARERARREYGHERMLDRIDEVYRSVLSEP